MGIIFQNISYTITVPVYLVIHILTSPLAQPPSRESAHFFEVDDLDLKLLPLCTLAALVLPSIAMFVPSPSLVPGPTHYTLIAIWQAFPLWHSALHWTLKRVLPAPSPRPRNHHSPSAAPAYKLILFFAIASHTALLAIALIPASAVPGTWSPVFAAVDFRSAFVPAPLWEPPALDAAVAAAVPVPADALAPLARYFLQWDVYCGGVAVMLWAMYLRRVVGGSDGGSAGMLRKVLGWGLVGGPVAVAAVVLWDRDGVLARPGLMDGKKRA